MRTLAFCLLAVTVVAVAVKAANTWWSVPLGLLAVGFGIALTLREKA